MAAIWWAWLAWMKPTASRLRPRVERRFGKGMTFFIDGQAEAQAVRGADAGWWSLPGSSTADLTMLGVTARTGLVR